MHHDTLFAPQRGCSLRRIGIRLPNCDWTVIEDHGMVMQIHSDAASGAHSLARLISEQPPRGAGVHICPFGVEPDRAVWPERSWGGTAIEPPARKPHGLRKPTSLAPDGQAFSPAIAPEVALG